MRRASHAKTKWGPRHLYYIALLCATVLTITGLGALKADDSLYSPLALVGGQAFSLEIASTPPERTKGLSGRHAFAANQAVLFVFHSSGVHCFWMKDMYFPIDMVWLSAEREVVHIQPSVPPNSYPEIFCPPKPAQYVLEYRAGMSQAVNLESGDEVFLRY